MLKILWFSLSPCGSLRRSGSLHVIQAWMISLEDEIKKRSDVKLSVAYFSDKKEAPFIYDGVTYYPMHLPMWKGKVGRMLFRFRSIKKLDELLLPEMLDVVKSANPDLIHIHGTEERFGLIQQHVKDIPIVFSIQGLLAPYAEKYFSGFPKSYIRIHESLADKLKGVSEIKSFNNFKLRAHREIQYLQEAHYIIGRTLWDKTITGLFNPCRQYFVGDEILRKEFYHAVWNKDKWGNPLTLVSTISPGPYKGIETLLKAASILSRNLKCPLKWKVIGLDSSSKWAKMAVKLTGVSPDACGVKFCGKMTSDQMTPLMNQCDIYCHVSHIENSPNSVCEAMLLGMPVIASWAGGTSSMLEHQKEGLLVQDGDPYALAAAVSWLYCHFDQAKTYGESARLRASIRHDANRIGSNLVNTYQFIIGDFKK